MPSRRPRSSVTEGLQWMRPTQPRISTLSWRSALRRPNTASRPETLCPPSAVTDVTARVRFAPFSTEQIDCFRREKYRITLAVCAKYRQTLKRAGQRGAVSCPRSSHRSCTPSTRHNSSPVGYDKCETRHAVNHLMARWKNPANISIRPDKPRPRPAMLLFFHTSPSQLQSRPLNIVRSYTM